MSRQPSQLKWLQHLGAELQQGDLDQEISPEFHCHNNLLYYFAPPQNSGPIDIRITRLLAQFNTSNKPAHIIYISTSGVYGDCQGQWVDETRPANPKTDRARRRLSAEQALLSWGETNNCAITIFRVGGIYGPKQLPIERLKAGLEVIRLSEAPYSNRIHSEDLARVCIAAAALTKHQGIYNVCDGQTSSMSEYFVTLARIAGLPAPTQISKEEAQTKLSPVMLSYLRESRRMDISKLKREFGIEFLYPNLDAGLTASLEQEASL